MKREAIEQSVANLHSEAPFERDSSKVRGGLDALAQRLGQSGLLLEKHRGAIEFPELVFTFNDTNTLWLRTNSGLIIDPHHPVLDRKSRHMMIDYAITGDNITKLKNRITKLLPDGELFPLGRTADELQELGVVYRSEIQLDL